jgi:hypothetical protein
VCFLHHECYVLRNHRHIRCVSLLHLHGCSSAIFFLIQLKQVQVSHEIPHMVPVDYMILISFSHLRVCGFFKLLFHRFEVLARTQVMVFVILIKLGDNITVSGKCWQFSFLTSQRMPRVFCKALPFFTICWDAPSSAVPFTDQLRGLYILSCVVAGVQRWGLVLLIGPNWVCSPEDGDRVQSPKHCVF